jgi:protein-tyrosine kinase
MKEHTNPVLRSSPLESRPVSKFGRAEAVPDRIAARVKPDERLVSLVSPATIEAEQYRTLGLMLEQRRHSGLLQVVAVSSPTMGDGKTVTSINLAAALAQSPQSRVLLVDADFRKPSVATQLGIRDHNTLGFRDAILNPDLALKDIVQRLPGSSLSLLTVGRSQVMPHEVIKSSRFAEVLDEARRDYEWIILDTAPLVLAPDCLMMGRSVDGFLIIVCAHKTTRKEIGEALNILGPSKLLGLVFNFDDSLLESYGYKTYLSASQAQQEELQRRE